MRLVDRETGLPVPAWKRLIGRWTGYRIFGGERYMWTSLEAADPEKPQRVPAVLRALANERGTTPQGLLEAVIGRSPNCAAAAAELGVSEATFRRWARRVGVRMGK